MTVYEKDAIRDESETETESEPKQETSDEDLTDMDEEDDDTEIIRCKWQGDGAKTLDELIEKLQEFIKHIRLLKAEGWELVTPMEDDYGFIKKNE